MSLTNIRSRIRSIDPVLWLVFALCLIAAWSFILRPSLPRETDAELHVFRAAEIGFNIRAGALYSRWAPDFYYGYGYPIFNYYAPLTYYLANLMTLVIPGGAVLGVKLVFILSFFIAGYSIFFLGKKFSTRLGGLIASACYLFSPYFYLIDPHLRGDLAEFFALALGPLAFWRLTRHIESPRPQTLIMATLSIAAIILTHNLLALVFFAMLTAYIIWTSFFSTTRPPTIREGIVRPLPLALALAVSAFFWLPVVLEQDAVQLSNLVGPGHFDYRNHFLTLSELFGPVVPLDLGAANPDFRLNLGLAQWILALIGLGAAIRAASLPRPEYEAGPVLANVSFWSLAGAFLIALMLPISGRVWDAVPQMAFLQFPWRLLGPANLCLALLAGFTGRLIPEMRNARWRKLLGTSFVMLPLIGLLPVLSPPEWDRFGPTDQQAILDFELSGIALGTTATGDFVPRDVELVPTSNPDLLASYQSSGPIDKVNRHTLPSGTSVEVLSHKPTQDQFRVDTTEPFVLRLYTFMFAGWKARIDGTLVDIEVAQPEGFITVPVPAGSHLVEVWLGSTPARTLSVGITLLGVLLLSLTARFAPVPTHRTGADGDAAAFDPRVIAAALVIFTTVAAVGSLLGIFQPHSTGFSVTGANTLEHHYVEGGADLLGYDISPTVVVPGEEVRVTLYWKAREPIGGNYQSFVHLTTEPQLAWSQSDNLNPGDYPTTRWPLDKYIRDEHVLIVPPGTPPRTYTVRAGLWNHLTGVRQLILEADGTILADAIPLSTEITVEKVDHQVRADPIMQYPTDTILVDNLKLHGFDIAPSPPLDFPAGYLVLTFYWEKLADTGTDFDLLLRLISEENSIEVVTDEGTMGGSYPVREWLPGLLVRDMHSLWIGPEVTPATYELQLAIRRTGSDDRPDWIDLALVERDNVEP